MSVKDLLEQSMNAHKAAASARNQRRPDARALLETAHRLRLEALALDPSRTDPAWSSEQVHTVSTADTHDSLMAFYEKQLAKP